MERLEEDPSGHMRPVNLQTMFHMNFERIHDTRYSTNVRQVFAPKKLIA